MFLRLLDAKVCVRRAAFPSVSWLFSLTGQDAVFSVPISRADLFAEVVPQIVHVQHLRPRHKLYYPAFETCV
jgi:hypothetical protein